MPDHDKPDTLDPGALIAPGSFHSFAPRPARPSDPAALIGWPPTLPLEIALRDGTPKEVCASYGISREEWERIRKNPHFVNELGRAVEALRVDGMGFKARAQLQAVEMLKESWRLVHDSATPHNVKAQLIIHTVRVAGLDASREQAPAGGPSGGGAAVSISINLGG
jgi:hypothetical protein